MELFFNYLKYEKKYSPHTVLAYQTDLEQFARHLKDHFQLTDLQQADHTLIRSWLVSMVQQQLDARTIHRKLASLRSYYRFLVRNGHMATNPASLVVAPKTKKRLPAFVPEQSLNKLFDNVTFEDSFEGWRDRLVMEFLYGTGTRVSELLGLRQQDLNLAEKTVRVLGKGNKQRIVPLNPSLISCLEEYMRQLALEGLHNPGGYLLVTRSLKRAYPKLIYRIVTKYLRQITSSDHVNPHVLRHSFATHLLDRGADLNAIKDLLGHASLAATQVYTHNSIEKLKAVFEKAHPKA